MFFFKRQLNYFYFNANLKMTIMKKSYLIINKQAMQKKTKSALCLKTIYFKMYLHTFFCCSYNTIKSN